MGGTRLRPVGEGGHIIEDEGVPLAQQPALNFLGAGVTAANAPGKTNVTIPGGGGGGSGDVFELLKTLLVPADTTSTTITLDTPVNFSDYAEIVCVISGIIVTNTATVALQMNGDVNSIYSYIGVLTSEPALTIAPFSSPESTTLEMGNQLMQMGASFYMKWTIEGGQAVDVASRRQGSGDFTYVENDGAQPSSSRGMTQIRVVPSTQLSSITLLINGGLGEIGQNTRLTIYGKKLTSGGGGGGGHIIEDETTPLPQRAALNFIGPGVTAVDNAGTDATDVTIPGGGLWEFMAESSLAGLNTKTITLDEPVADFMQLMIVVNGMFEAAQDEYQIFIDDLLGSVEIAGYSSVTAGSLSQYTANLPAIRSGIQDAQFEPTLCEVIIFGHVDTNGKLMGTARFIGQAEPGNETYEVNMGLVIEPEAGTNAIGDIVVNSIGGTNFSNDSYIRIYKMKVIGAPGGTGNGHVIEDEGIALAQRTILNFVGAGVTSADVGGKSVVTIPGGGAGGHIIEDEGTPLPAQPDLNFVGSGVAVTDDIPNTATVVTIQQLGHVIENEGTPIAQQADLNFVGAGVTVADAGGKTVVTIPGGAGSGSVIGSVKTVGLVNSVDIVLTETIPFDGTVAEIELVATCSIDTTPDSLQVTINNDVGAVYDTTLVKVSTAGVVTGSHVAAATSWGSGETVAIGGFMSMLRMTLGVGGNLGGDRPAIEFFETCGGPPPPSTVVYREGRGIHVGTLANITSIQVKTAAGNNFVIGSQFTVFKRVDIAAGGGGHVIEDEGTPLPTQPALNFVGAGVQVTDDIPNSATVVTIDGGSESVVFNPFTVKPEDYHYFYDEFFYPDPDPLSPNFPWEQLNVGLVSWIAATNTVGGVIRGTTGGNSNDLSGLRTCGGGLVAVDGSQKFKIVWTTLTQDAQLGGATRIGLFAAGAAPAGTYPFSSEPTPHIWFAEDGSGNWLAQTNNGVTPVSIDTGVAVDPSNTFRTFEISFEPTGTPTITWKINGVTVATSIANLPTGVMSSGFVHQTAGPGSNRVFEIDTALIVNGVSPAEVIVPFDAKTTAVLEDEFVYQDAAAIQDKYNFSGLNTPILTSVPSDYGRASCAVGTGSGNFVQLDTLGAFVIDDNSTKLVYKTKMIIRFDDITGNHSFLSGFATANSADKGSTEAAMMAAIEFGFGFFVDINDNQNWKVWLNTDISKQSTDTGINAPSGTDCYLEAEYVKATGVCTFKITVAGVTSGTFQLTQNALRDELLLFAYARQLVSGTTRFEIDYWSLEAVRTIFA